MGLITVGISHQTRLPREARLTFVKVHVSVDIGYVREGLSTLRAVINRSSVGQLYWSARLAAFRRGFQGFRSSNRRKVHNLFAELSAIIFTAAER